MQRPSSQRNPWIVLAGAILVIALAIGLLQGGAGAAPVGTSGYGGGGGGGGGGTGNGQPPADCGGNGGYGGAPCPSEVSNLSNDPAKPVKGKGFKVKFSSKSGGAYDVFVVRNGNKKQLEQGYTGAGKTTTKKVGKKLKAGRYSLRVKVQSSLRLKADTAKKTLKIVK